MVLSGLINGALSVARIATSVASRINIPALVSTFSSVAKKVVNIGAQVTSRLVGLLGGAEGATGAFSTLLSSAISGATQLGEAFIPSITGILQNGIIPNFGSALTGVAEEYVAAEETGTQIDASAALVKLVDGAVKDFQSISAQIMNGVSRVDTNSLTQLVSELSSSSGTIMASFGTWIEKLKTISSEYLEGVGADTLASTYSDLASLSDEFKDSFQILIAFINQVIEERVAADKPVQDPTPTDPGTTTPATQTPTTQTPTTETPATQTPATQTPTTQTPTTETPSTQKPSTTTPTTTTPSTSTTPSVSNVKLSTEKRNMLKDYLNNTAVYNAATKIPAKNAIMVKYDSKGNLEDYFATVTAMNTDGTFTIKELSGRAADGTEQFVTKNLKVSDFSKGEYSYYLYK